MVPNNAFQVFSNYRGSAGNVSGTPKPYKGFAYVTLGGIMGMGIIDLNENKMCLVYCGDRCTCSARGRAIHNLEGFLARSFVIPKKQVRYVPIGKKSIPSSYRGQGKLNTKRMKTSRKPRATRSVVRKTVKHTTIRRPEPPPLIVPAGANYRITEHSGRTIVEIKRISDGVKFRLGDFVTNGTRMRGKIEEFDMEPAVNSPKPYNDLTIYTDWSGIGMNLDSVYHPENNARKPDAIVLPAAFQPGDFCGLKLGKTDIIGAQVTKVAFTTGKVLYDVEIGVGNETVTRVHSVSSEYIVPLSTENLK